MIVDVLRAERIESQHQVDACAVDEHGFEVFVDGVVDEPVFVRSTAKPFIAAAAIAAGVRERFGLSMEEIAVMSASHSGQTFHVEAVTSLLAKIGLDADALQCGAHLPYNAEAANVVLKSGEPPTALQNNCSGKHAGILALTRMLSADPGSYLELAHPAQQAILVFCARLFEADMQSWPLGIDGCGIPVFAVSLRQIALAFARFATLRGIDESTAQALLVVRDAMLSYPEYVAGTGELDTLLMQRTGGAIVCKAGAEGVHGVAVLGKGVGYAGKVRDGASRARGPSTVAGLERIGGVPTAALGDLANPLVYNRAGRAVGAIRVQPVAISTAQA